MSVEFLCPHCRTAMRTPDQAMGTECDCPSCAGRLTVPTVAIPVIDSPATPTPEPSPAPVVEAPSEVGPFDFEAAPSSSSSAPSTPTYRRRRKSPWPVITVIAACVVLLVGVVVLFIGQSEPTLVGEVTGRVRVAAELTSTIPIPTTETADLFAKEVADDPVVLKTDLFTTTLSSDGSQLTVAVRPTEAGRLVEVDLTADPGVAWFLKAHGLSLSASRDASVSQDTSEMVERAGVGPVDRPVLATYRDRVALASLQHTLGPYVIAESGGFAHPVVTESTPGVLGWVLPPDVTSFVIRPNPTRPGRLPKTFRYQVQVESPGS